jgi:MFS transporter, DHA1 family, multidrug resistance protein
MYLNPFIPNTCQVLLPRPSASMLDLIRDSVFGQLVRVGSGNKVFQYPDEKDPSIRDKYINREKSANLAVHGTVQPPHSDKEEEDDTPPSRTSSELTDLKSDADPPTNPPAGLAPSDTLQQITSHTNSFLGELEKSNSRVSRVNTASGKPVDPEKGRDIHLVDWYGPDDPEVDHTHRDVDSTLTHHRTLRIGPERRSFGSHSKYASLHFRCT